METMTALPSLTPTARLFKPLKDLLVPYFDFKPEPSDKPVDQKPAQQIANEMRAEIQNLIGQKNYPCVAALKSFHKNDYQLGLYGRLGEGTPGRDLRQDLLYFMAEQKRTGSTYLSFFAIFDKEDLTEEEFENALWKELSLLTSEEERATDWGPGTVSDPANPAFRFSLGGSEFFVVGLHSQSSRQSRRFSRPALVFNVWDQFAELIRTGHYQPMVEMNRQRDQKFQGEANPMVVQHGDDWESIQFSGRQNSQEWKCPFSFLKHKLRL